MLSASSVTLQSRSDVVLNAGSVTRQSRRDVVLSASSDTRQSRSDVVLSASSVTRIKIAWLGPLMNATFRDFWQCQEHVRELLCSWPPAFA